MEEYDKYEDKGRTGMIAMLIVLLCMIGYGLFSTCEDNRPQQQEICDAALGRTNLLGLCCK
jgi:hypothetical protein